MPLNLPVLSKGALRTLRNLALGTSCTIAFTTGVLTEDRRQRIRSAKQAYDNAVRLKTLRHYHESRTRLPEKFEEQVLQYREDGVWLSAYDGTLSEQASAPIEVNQQCDHSEGKAAVCPEPRALWKSQPMTRIEPLRVDVQGARSETAVDRQVRLASDIRHILDSHLDSSTIDPALRRFFGAFDEGVDLNAGSLQSCLMDVVRRLSLACRYLGRIEDMEKILDTVISTGKVSQYDFDGLSPDVVVDRLLRPSVDARRQLTAPEKLQKAASLYLMEFKEDPLAVSSKLLPFATEICVHACRLGLHDLAVKVYRRAEAVGGPLSGKAVASFIIAAQMTGNDKDAIACFLGRFINAPNQTLFRDVINAVVESAIAREVYDKYEEAENLLVAALKSAEINNLKVPTTMFLKLFGHEWRTSKNILRIRAKFDRLEPLLPSLMRPIAAYAAIIQFCVLAKDVAAAENYRTRFIDQYGDCNDAQIAGSFALVKAMQRDWEGVKADFARMAAFKFEFDKEKYGSAFTPILKIFANSYSIAETEDFLRCFMEDYQVPLTRYAFNLMVDGYAKVKEIDSIARWVQYAISASIFVDQASMFNTILNQLYKTWDFNFEQVLHVYYEVQKLSLPCTNDFTLSILRRLAIAASNGDWRTAKKKLKFLPDSYEFRHRDVESIRLSMVEALMKKDPSEALSIYTRAVDEDVFISPAVVGKAVQASLELNGGELGDAVLLLHQAKQKGYDLSKGMLTLLLYQVRQLKQYHHDNNFNFIKSCGVAIKAVEDRGIVIPSFVFTQITSILVDKRLWSEAIGFWASVSRTRTSKIELDLASLTVLLEAYIGLRNVPGVTWVMTMLSANNLFPDSHLKLLLKRTCKEIRESGREDRFDKVVKEAYRCVIDMRADAEKGRAEAKTKTIQIMKKAAKSRQARQQSAVVK